MILTDFKIFCKNLQEISKISEPQRSRKWNEIWIIFTYFCGAFGTGYFTSFTNTYSFYYTSNRNLTDYLEMQIRDQLTLGIAWFQNYGVWPGIPPSRELSNPYFQVFPKTQETESFCSMLWKFSSFDIFWKKVWKFWNFCGQILKKLEVLNEKFDFVRSRLEPDPVTFFYRIRLLQNPWKKHRIRTPGSRLRLRIPAPHLMDPPPLISTRL